MPYVAPPLLRDPLSREVFSLNKVSKGHSTGSVGLLLFAVIVLLKVVHQTQEVITLACIFLFTSDSLVDNLENILLV